MKQRWWSAGCLAMLAGALIFVSESGAQTPADAAVRVHAQRANEALQAGKPDKAIPEFDAIVALDPKNVDAQANLGVLLYFSKQFDPALMHLRAALALQPDLGKIRGLLGLCELSLGKRQEATADLKAALPQLDEPPFAKQVGLVLVELQTSAGDHAAAAETAQLLRSRQPSDPEVLYACYRTSTDLAGEALLGLSLDAPASGQMQQAIAHELLRVRDIPAAIASFRRAVAADPKLPGIHFELAEALRASPATADRADAEKEYQAALSQNPLDTQSKIRLADLLSEKSSWADARRLYDSALAADPNSSDAAVGLARVESENGNDDKAATLLERAVASDPTNILAHFRLSAEYRKLHRPDDAKKEITEYGRLKALKEKLQQVYSTMKMTAPGTEGSPASSHANP